MCGNVPRGASKVAECIDLSHKVARPLRVSAIRGGRVGAERVGHSVNPCRRARPGGSRAAELAAVVGEALGQAAAVEELE